MDVWGPYSTVSLNGQRYFVTLVDDFTKYTWLHLITAKYEVASIVFNFIAHVKIQYSNDIQSFRTDNDT